jgi:DNA repair protein RadD
VELRPYQAESVSAVYSHLRERDDNPCVVIPTGGGKTPVLATLCRDAIGQWQGRVMVLAHVKELLEQNLDKIRQVDPATGMQTGVYSAGLRSRDTEYPVTVAGIQSVYKRAFEFEPFDLIIIDEAHLIPPGGEGMYRTFLDDAMKVNPNLRIIGLTATPFRMRDGMICSPVNILNHVCYEIGVKELIVQGYLCPLISKAGGVEADTSSLHVRAGEFVSEEVEALMNTDSLVVDACAEILHLTKDRNSTLIFSSGVDHGKHIVDTLHAFGHSAEAVFGDTPSEDRARVISEFKEGRLKYLVNMNVLTTGFDAPNVDCIALLRPTLSPGLYYQMVGRGFRMNPGKADCLVLDYGGNVLRHGPVDDLQIKKRPNGKGEAPAKKCPNCAALIACGFAVCPQCGFEFPPPERNKHDSQASEEGILSGQVTTAVEDVKDVRYFVHTKRDADDSAPKTMRVEYDCGFCNTHNEWVCFEHTGFARQKAEQWWRIRRGIPNAYVPSTAAEAGELAKAGELCKTRKIIVRTVSGERYGKIVAYDLEETLESEEKYEDVPF